ncbi:MAG: exodeoxyribonuclease III [Promethearchaeota archaeon]
MLKIISWNVNGLNAAIKKGLLDFIKSENADIYCFQEVKVSDKTISKDFMDSPILKPYNLYWNKAEKNGYSGTMTLTKQAPLAVLDGMNQNPELDREGRLITTEFKNFYLINGYVPNAGAGLKRLDFKLDYNNVLWDYLDELKAEKSVVLTGDLNVAHEEIDLANPSSNRKNAGFTQEERDSFSDLLSRGYIDTFRSFNSGGGHYTYWSYRSNARARDVGWRLDYFVCNSEFLPSVQKFDILKDVLGSDHCPIGLTLNV